MKTNILRLSLVALAAMVMAACSQNEELAAITDGQHPLMVSATVQDFTPDASTRVTDEATTDGYVSKFEKDDQIGVYVILDGTLMCKNLPLTYDGTKWSSDSPLYFYKNATYIAYSPYNTALTAQTIASVADITAYFTNTVMADDTKTYKECDLMTAIATTDTDLPEANASAFTFNFSHAMSMVEYHIPVSNYKTTSGYEYSSPIFGLKLQKQEGTAVKADIATLALGKGIYRSLLAPVAADVTDKDLTFHGEFYAGDGTQPVYFSTSTAFRPEAGKYKKVTVTYTNAPDATVENRDLAVGDYFYADGGIVPGNAATIPSKNCIGIVYSTDMTNTDTGKANAYVIALNDVGKPSAANKTLWWSAQNATVIPRFDTAVEGSFATMMADMNGYTVREGLKSTGVLSNFEACNIVSTNGAKLPDGTTGWYLPTLAQLTTAICNLSGGTIGTAVNPLITMTTAQYDAFVKRFTDVGGTDLPATGGDTFCLWTCTDVSDTNAWALKFNLKNTTRTIEAASLKKANQTNRTMQGRPVFAF